MRACVLLTLAATVTAGLQPFGFERYQLQSQDLQHLHPADTVLFGFGDSTRTVNQTSRCKVFPGDSAWPSPRIWDLLNQVTGHDFSGKSGGAGALSIWTHNLKGIQYVPSYNASGTDWTGAAFKIGAGIQAYEIYKAAQDRQLVVVGGEGQTVGVAGASFTENTELFWALRGGGGSTFGVVTSVTIKAYPTIPVTTSTFTWSTGAKSNITHKNFWAGFHAYLNLFIEHSDAGIYSYFFILPSNGELTFLMQPFFAPNKTITETEALLEPWFQRLHQLGIRFIPKTQYFDNFYSAWNASFPLEVVEKTHVATGSRLFPKTNWEDPTRLNATFDAIKASSQAGLTLIAFNMAPRGEHPDNAVNPAWRRTVMHALSSVNWSPNATAQEIAAARHNFTYGHMQRWRDVSPGAGSYLGESDHMEPGFQQAFYGENYGKLLKLEREMDPGDVFWAATAVGSEGWRVVTDDGLPTENGKLCRA
ncbi:hypothetical protein ABOM_007518 [Aspergillus bombycis]|uniref:Berberine/berberine-like domain-containing protein n=1 Tax=Aspergillus bombycis TaxID=109264 RepID=A0A1F7ZV05_9EURO|nr:hypothetical protein ABOM_007518 [Aspergillus bombycis]OGM42908.1 hypothetical protein ABOM_007518 [Aspergillus bombycis]